MANPCEIEDCVSPEEASRQGCLKWLIPLLLGLLGLIMLNQCRATPEPTIVENVVEVTVEVTEVIEVTREVEVEVTSEVVVEVTREVEVEVPAAAPAAVIAPLVGGRIAYDAGDGLLTWFGTGNRDYTVRLIGPDGEVAEGTVAANGNWSFAEALNLEPGEHCFTVQMFDEAGDMVEETDNVCVTVEAPEVVEATPEPEPAPADSALVVTDVEDNGFSGTYEPGTTLLFTEDGTSLGSATVGDDGTFAGTCQLPPGAYTIVVSDEASGASETVELVVEGAPAFAPPTGESVQVVCEGTPAMGAINGNIYTIAACEYISLIADRLGTTVALLQAYNPQISDFSLIYAGQQLVIPADAGCFDASN